MSSRSLRSPLRSVVRILSWTGISVLVLLLLVAGYLFIPVLPDPSPGFIARRGELQQVEVTRRWNTPTASFSDIRLTSSSGLQAQLIIRRPRHVTTPRPLVILMGGYQTGRHAVELIQDAHGLVTASIDYPYHGKEATDDIGFLRNVSAIRQALLDTPPVVLLALDYLAQQNYVDAQRIELAGVSFGAFLAAIPGALDPRFKRVWLIHGSGDPPAVFDHLTTDKIKSKPLRWLLTRSFAILIQSRYLKPERWVGRISPRPVMLVHARNDPSFPAESIASLHRALHQPYKIIWLGEEHIGVRSRQLIQAITDLISRYILQPPPAKGALQ
jgi:pimeloyl-ACP methyl ester carboxylesterase